MDEIIKIILKRNKERKLLTDEDVKKICYLILKNKGYNFVKHVEVLSHNPSSPNCAAVFYGENIFFFFKEIIDLLQENFEKFSCMYEIDGANVDIYNYLYLNIIFHELAHVRQQAVVNSNHNCLEKKLFSIFLNMTDNRDLYDENYSNILTEVNANNAALITTNYIYSKLPKNFLTKNDWQVYQLFSLRTMLYDNYDIIQNKEIVVSPAERIIDCFDKYDLSFLNITANDFTKLIYNNDNLTIYKKLMLGLPISYLEYSYSNLVNDRLNSQEKINLVKKLQKSI